MLGRRFWMIASLMAATLLMTAACGGGQDDGGAGSPAGQPAGAPAQGEGAIGPPPHVFVGTVSMDGSPASDGTLVTAFIEGNSSPVAQAEVSGGSYTLMVEQPAGGDYGGKSVTFTVSDIDTSPSKIWEFGGANEVNLSVSGERSGSGTG